jgi:hypothetical protein
MTEVEKLSVADRPGRVAAVVAVIFLALSAAGYLVGELIEFTLGQAGSGDDDDDRVTVVDRCREPAGDISTRNPDDCAHRTQQFLFGDDSRLERWWLQLDGADIAAEESWIPVTVAEYDRHRVGDRWSGATP